jgi:hypothetical protein
VTVAPALLTLQAPSDFESQLISALVQRLGSYSLPNMEAEQRYDGSWVTKQFGISIPPNMRGLRVVAGWAGTTIDVLEERLDWLGWTSDGEDFGLSDIYEQNSLDVDSGMAHLDSLIFGTSFVAVGSGYEGEPAPLITPQSPKNTTGIWDQRLRRLSAALNVIGLTATLYLPGQTVTLERGVNTSWVVVDRDEHGLGRIPIVIVPNRVRASRESGRSEITRAVRYYADAAVRTLMGLEVNREFYNAPQRWALNVNESDFEDASGNKVNPWTSIQGRVWAVPPNADDQPEPKVGQFAPASPAPYLDQIRGYAQLLAAEAGIPASYLGFTTDNPASADAIRAGEARLVKRAERRQVVFGRAWLEVARLALMVRDGNSTLPDLTSITSRWRDAATPTRAAAADEALKLTSGDNPILPPDSTVTYDRIGLSPQEQKQVMADKRRTSGTAALRSLLPVAAPVDAQPQQ